MQNVITNAEVIAHRANVALSGVRLTYRYDGKALTPMVVIGRAEQETDGDGNFLSTLALEWVAESAEMYHDGSHVIPSRGHEFDWTDASNVKHTFQVLPQDDGRCFRYCDPTRALLRTYGIEGVLNVETPEP